MNSATTAPELQRRGQLIGHLVMASRCSTKSREAENLRESIRGNRAAAEARRRQPPRRYAWQPKAAHDMRPWPSAISTTRRKLNAFAHLMREDPNVDSSWTTYNANLERKLYKGARGEGRGARDEASET